MVSISSTVIASVFGDLSAGKLDYFGHCGSLLTAEILSRSGVGQLRAYLPVRGFARLIDLVLPLPFNSFHFSCCVGMRSVHETRHLLPSNRAFVRHTKQRIHEVALPASAKTSTCRRRGDPLRLGCGPAP